LRDNSPSFVEQKEQKYSLSSIELVAFVDLQRIIDKNSLFFAVPLLIIHEIIGNPFGSGYRWSGNLHGQVRRRVK